MMVWMVLLLENILRSDWEKRLSGRKRNSGRKI
jgi:hypothetical protein